MGTMSPVLLVVDVVLGSVNAHTDSVPEGPGQVPGASGSGEGVGLSGEAGGGGASQGSLDGGADLRLEAGDDLSDER